MNEVHTHDIQRQAVTVRLDPDLHEALRTYSFHTRRSANETITNLLREFLDGPGRAELIGAVVTETQERHVVALDKLRG